MALIDVVVVKHGVKYEDKIEDFDWAALTTGDRVNTVELGDVYVVARKEVEVKKDASNNYVTKRVLYT